MNYLFDGLNLYEIIMLVLGVFLFFILSIGLLYYIIKKEQFGKMLLFFVIPIIMIGYPSIKEISISNNKILLSKYQKDLIENPENTDARVKVEELTEKLEGRARKSEDIVQISCSKLLLGKMDEAAVLAEKAIAKDATNREAKTIKNLLIIEKAVEGQQRLRPDLELNTSAVIELNRHNNKTNAMVDSVIRKMPSDEDVKKYTPFLSPKTVSKLKQSEVISGK